MLFKESQRHKSGGRRGQHCLPLPSQRTGTGWPQLTWLLVLDGVQSTSLARAAGEREGTGYHGSGTYRSWTRQKKVDASILSPGQVGHGTRTTTNMTRKTLFWHAT